MGIFQDAEKQTIKRISIYVQSYIQIVEASTNCYIPSSDSESKISFLLNQLNLSNEHELHQIINKAISILNPLVEKEKDLTQIKDALSTFNRSVLINKFDSKSRNALNLIYETSKKFFSLIKSIEDNKVNEYKIGIFFSALSPYENNIINFSLKIVFLNALEYLTQMKKILSQKYQSKIINNDLESLKKYIKNSDSKINGAKNINSYSSSSSFKNMNDYCRMDICDEEEEERKPHQVMDPYKQQILADIGELRLKELQDQSYSNGSMLGLLASAENYASRPNDIKKYGYYDYFNSAKYKNKLEKKKELLIEIKNFQFSYEVFIDDYQKYKYPANLKKRDIFNDINEWMSKVAPEDRKYYQTIKDILDGKPTPNYSKDLKALPKANKNIDSAAYNKMENFPKITKYALVQAERVAKGLKEKKADYAIEAELYGKPGDEKLLKSVNPNLAKYNPKSEFENFKGYTDEDYC